NLDEYAHKNSALHPYKESLQRLLK
ncbi:MAG: hypothetical protein RLZZ406_1119, partial [Pseudomonadota bacterium]